MRYYSETYTSLKFADIEKNYSAINRRKNRIKQKKRSTWILKRGFGRSFIFIGSCRLSLRMNKIQLYQIGNYKTIMDFRGNRLSHGILSTTNSKKVKFYNYSVYKMKEEFLNF